MYSAGDSVQRLLTEANFKNNEWDTSCYGFSRHTLQAHAISQSHETIAIVSSLKAPRYLSPCGTFKIKCVTCLIKSSETLPPKSMQSSVINSRSLSCSCEGQRRYSSKPGRGIGVLNGLYRIWSRRSSSLPSCSTPNEVFANAYFEKESIL